MINFTPGPSQLYHTVPDHVKKAFRTGIPSLSHRSKQFENIFSETTDGLRTLLNVPPNFTTVFTGSATEIWERVVQNLVEEKSLHFVNGAFSKRFFEIAGQLNKRPDKAEVPAGQSFDRYQGASRTEVVALTHNETSTGVALSLPFMQAVRAAHPESLLVVDAVSSLPYVELDYAAVDSVFFSVQKGFGLPAGLGVWMVNERCLAKADQLISMGLSIGSYHSLPTLHAHALKHQTPETPNVLGIYLLGKVVQDFLQRGIQMIRKETEYKAAVLYQALEKHDLLDPFVSNKDHRSKTVIVANSGERTARFSAYLQQKGFYPGDGYGDFKTRQLRFANFPAHSKEQFEGLADAFEKFS